MPPVTGKVYLVTGSTDGIGQHTAMRLAQAGADVIVHGRSQARVDAAVKKVEGASKGGKVYSCTADLASFDDIRRLAAELKQNHPRIDVLINNAGVFAEKMVTSADGFELTWAVNVLAPFLLTSLLLDSITERIVNVSSISAGSSIDFDNLNQEKGFSSHSAYSLSKLAMMLYTYSLAERLKSTGITVNTLDPGTVNTKMLYAGWGACGMRVQDADDEFYLATSSDVAKTTGAYFVGQRKTTGPRISYDKSLQERLWKVLEEQTGAKYPWALQ